MKNIILIFCLFVLSCSNNLNIKESLKQLQSSSINIPIELITNYNGTDTLINGITDSKLKFIVYIDSTNCSSCSINKMGQWKPILKYAQSYNGRLKFCYIFYPTESNINELRTALKMNSLDYPVLIDLNGDFEKMNPHLPKNKAMHTFLLDENNKVILVGNPLQNKEIEKLFYKKTQELLSK